MTQSMQLVCDKTEEKSKLVVKLAKLLEIPGIACFGTFYRKDILDCFGRPTEWNPIKRNEDTFLLAHDLRMDVNFDNRSVCKNHHKTGKAFCNFAKGDDIISMRLAIVEAALGYDK